MCVIPHAVPRQSDHSILQALAQAAPVIGWLLFSTLRGFAGVRTHVALAPAGLSVGAIVGIGMSVLVVAALGSFGATVFARQMKHKHGAHRTSKDTRVSIRNGAGVVGDIMLTRLDVPH